MVRIRARVRARIAVMFRVRKGIRPVKTLHG